MAQSSDSLVELVQKVSHHAGTPQEYEKLNILLRNLSQEELEEAVSNHNVIDIFGHMDLSRSEISELALSMATVIFSAFHLTEFIPSHESELCLAISSKNYELRDFIISRLEEGVINSKPENCDVTEKILTLIGNIAIQDEIEQAASALSFIQSFALHHPRGVKTIASLPPFKECFSLNKEEQIIRVSEMFIQIVIKNPLKLPVIDEAKCFEGLFGAFRISDPLLQMNYIAILKIFTSIPEGRAYLHSNGMIDVLLEQFYNMHKNPFGSMLLPGFLSFFGEIAGSEPSKYLGQHNRPNAFVDAIANATKDPNPAVFISALETIAFICRNSEGKLMIAPYLASGASLENVLPHLGHLIANAASGQLVRVIYILADLLRVSRNPDLPVNDLVPVAHTAWLWLGRIAGAPSDTHGAISVHGARILTRIWHLAKQPFYESRAACFHLLEALATEPWCVHLFLEQPGFMEYLLNRGTEEKLAADNPSLQPAKFAIVVQCCRTQERWNGVCPLWCAMDETQVAQLKAHIKEGIWGTRTAEAVVQMESSA